jgi:hypothetical protein
MEAGGTLKVLAVNLVVAFTEIAKAARNGRLE